MKKTLWCKKLFLAALLSGSLLLQTPTCAEQAAFVTAASSAMTAGGVLYLVSRVVSG